MIGEHPGHRLHQCLHGDYYQAWAEAANGSTLYEGINWVALSLIVVGSFLLGWSTVRVADWVWRGLLLDRR